MNERIQVSTVDEFAEWARLGGEALLASNIRIQVPEGSYEGQGQIALSGGKFVLDVSLSDGALPTLTKRTYAADEFWSLSGLINGTLPFFARGLPRNRSNRSGTVTSYHAQFPLSFISFATSELRKHEEEFEELAKRILKKKSNRPRNRHSCRAYLEGNAPIWRNAATEITTSHPYLGRTRNTRYDTYHSNFSGLKYALVRQGDDGVLDAAEIRPTTDDRKFKDRIYALFDAIALVQGTECWPQRITLRRGRITLTDDVWPHRSPISSSFSLLSETACANGANFGKAIELATCFFMRGDGGCNLVKRLAYLCRQSSAAPFDAGTLAIASCFEGLVTGLHELLVPRATDSGFAEAKSVLVELSEMHARAGNPHFKRLTGYISSARESTTVSSLKEVCQHLKLCGKAVASLESALQAWKLERNSLAHGREPSGRFDERLFRQSRIAGGMMVLIAGLLGYEGLVRASAFEDQYVTIGLNKPTL